MVVREPHTMAHKHENMSSGSGGGGENKLYNNNNNNNIIIVHKLIFTLINLILLLR
jgi:hypothetical protein